MIIAIGCICFLIPLLIQYIYYGYRLSVQRKYNMYIMSNQHVWATVPVKVQSYARLENDKFEYKFSYKKQEYVRIGEQIPSVGDKIRLAVNPFIDSVELPENLDEEVEIYNLKEMHKIFTSEFLDLFFSNSKIDFAKEKMSFKPNIIICILCAIIGVFAAFFIF